MTFLEHLRGALAALASESPEHHRAMVACIGSRTVALQVDGETVQVDFRSAPPARSSSEQRAYDVRVIATRRTIVDLAEARGSVEAAVWRGDLELFGGVADLLAFHDALQAFLHGAVRAPDFDRRFHRFREDSSPSTDLTDHETTSQGGLR